MANTLLLGLAEIDPHASYVSVSFSLLDNNLAATSVKIDRKEENLGTTIRVVGVLGVSLRVDKDQGA